MNEFCDAHIEIAKSLVRIEERLIAVDKRINGSVDDIENHIKHGNKWRLSIASVAVGLLISIMSAVFFYGRLCSVVEDNTREIEVLREK